MDINYNGVTKEKKLSVIIPIYKAEEFIKNNLIEIRDSIAEHFRNFEIIAVIDGEVDRSKEEAEKVEGIKVLSYKENKGKGYALAYGFKHSTGDYVTFVDCDMDLHPAQLRNFLPYLATADLVIGSKRHPFSKVDYPLIRKILSVGFWIYSYLVLGVKLRDTQSGLKLIKREVLEIIIPLLISERFTFDIELCFLAQQHGFKIVEAPLNLTFGKGSTIKIKDIFNMFWSVLKIRYNYSIKKYYQKKFWENMGWEKPKDKINH